MSAFCVEVPLDDPKAMEEFQAMMDALWDEHNDYVRSLAKELTVSEACAADVVYLRSRSRHTNELERELIRLHSVGTPPNMGDFGHAFKGRAWS